jgi:hypothetical protein
MSAELFPADSVASDSPRLRWMKILRLDSACDHELPAETQWLVWNVDDKIAAAKHGWTYIIGKGATVEEACEDYAFKRGVKLWNEASA